MSAKGELPDTMPNLGDLELVVLDHVWKCGYVSAKQVHAALAPSRSISVNTVQSTLERLYRKALLERRKRAHAYLYTARVTREELVAACLHDLIDRFGGNPAASITAFMDRADELDSHALDRLEAMIRARRQY